MIRSTIHISVTPSTVTLFKWPQKGKCKATFRKMDVLILSRGMTILEMVDKNSISDLPKHGWRCSPAS